MTNTALLKKILLVDDNPLFLKMLSQAFYKAGFNCITCNSAAEAIAVLVNYHPDAILSDYQMPEMDGLEFRRYVLEQDNLKDIPFIFLTHFSDEDLVTTGLNLNAIDYVIKDTPVSVIISKLNNLINTVSKQRQLSELEIKKAVDALNIRSVPQKAPDVEGYEINFWHKSYHDIPGGDFIDFINITGRFTFIILGDVMGKKWMAWFLSFSFLSYIRSAVRFGIMHQDYSPARILEKVNQVICTDDALKDILSSLSLVMIDHNQNKIIYAGAGDLPVVHYKASTKSLEILRCSGLLLGLFENGFYDEKEIEPAEGDQLFIFTDGIIDFTADQQTKTDYNLFVNHLKDITSQEDTFKILQQQLTAQPLSLQVDDCSIIHLYKTPKS